MGRDRERRRELRAQLHRLDGRGRRRATARGRPATRRGRAARAADVGCVGRARRQPRAEVAAQQDRQHAQGAPRARRVEGSRRTGARTRSCGRARGGAEPPEDGRPGSSDRDHRGTSCSRPEARRRRSSADDRRDQTVRGRLRHPRHRHLSRLEAAGHARGRATGQHRHQRRRRHDAHRRARDRPQGDLDDAPDRLERRPAAAALARLPHVPSSSLHGLRRDRRRRPRALLLRRPPPTRDERAGQAARLELELLEPRPTAAAPRAQRRPAHRRVHRAARRARGHRQRRRHRRQRPRRRRRSLRDRGAEKPEQARQGSLQRPSRRDPQGNRARTPGRQPSAAGHRHPRRIHRPRAVRAAQRTRLPLPPLTEAHRWPPCRHIRGR